MTIADIASAVIAIVATAAMLALVIPMASALWDWADSLQSRRQERRTAEAESTLDRKQMELRRTILNLADAIADERIQHNQASVEMIRAAYVSRGQLP